MPLRSLSLGIIQSQKLSATMSNKVQLKKAEADSLKAEHPELPDDYLDYLQNVGWGESESGRMIYSSPVSPSHIYGGRLEGSRVLLLGDDTQGYCFGFHSESLGYEELSSAGTWEPWPDHLTFGDYAAANED